MKPDRLTKLMHAKGELKTYPADQVYHSQDFKGTLFMLKSGYVKRYQVTDTENKVIELIYGPSHIFPLSHLFRELFDLKLNQENLVYVYQTMTDAELISLKTEIIIAEIQNDPLLYQDLYYEAGLRLQSNIDRLASNALKDDYKKVVHQLICLAREFGDADDIGATQLVKILVPLENKDIAEQLNISANVVEAVISSLVRSELIQIENNVITINDTNLLRDSYL